MNKLPIVYVRGFAGGDAGIDRAVEDPFYGFNDGSVHIRVGLSGKPSFYQFESPLLRLMGEGRSDHSPGDVRGGGYEVFVRGSQEQYLRDAASGSVEPASIWVHRFYDTSARSLPSRALAGGDEDDIDGSEAYREFDLESAAESLREFVMLIKDRTGAPRVHLVAHSMGGLICRCLIQKVLPDRGEHALQHVDRFFTYGTPHGGIHFSVGFGLLEKMRDTLNIQGGNIFGRREMYAYLTPEAERGDRPPPDWKANRIPPQSFPGDRVFCLVGTNPSDYDVALGLSAKAVGPKSDGLVQIESAYISDANFAFVHRSHSGRYGMVNSEEGYQNLKRFLFGDLQVTADLVHYRLPGEPNKNVTWQAETRLSVRGLPIVMHEQLAAHHCPIQLEWPKDTDTADRPTPLVTTFLSSQEGRPDNATKMRYVLHLRVLSLQENNGLFSFGDHLEQSADFDDMLVVDIEAPDSQRSVPRAWATWASQIKSPLRGYDPPEDAALTDQDDTAGRWVRHVPLPSPSGSFLGESAAVRLTVQGRRPADDPSYAQI
ncbi:hypothetical protein LSI54_09430 [Nesterenkonia sp. AY15]|uniref:esterase/lipase family protein n=1 Tax=Nesterenkonia sp. AY15 TaxID=2901139 RepID=UPI001F4CE05E|nr:alpha/beta fold hydrolase [Nesterenkonia sp. AY15]MCH8571572.1 hypothetical protein [Nesterenkonia sp. AY15]